MTNFTHEVPYVETIVNAVIKDGVFNGHQVKQGTLIIYKIDRLMVVGLCDGFGGAYDIIMKDGYARTTERVSKFAVEQQRVEFKCSAPVYIG